MSLAFAARAALCCSLVGVLLPDPVRAQTWNDPRTRALVELATARRAEQLADTALLDYRATAHGYVTFLAQMGEGFPEPPKVVKADELALEVYWRAPDLSKQIIDGRRDTTLLPTDIQYHRDHLGIVQNNFPSIIRLGEGDEVRDVPHPLSRAGLEEYDYALTDSLRISIPGRTIRVYEVKVRPRNDREPRVIGAVYIDADGGQVVRMAFNFTHAAFLDKRLEDLSIVLENGLVGTRFWLPRKQEIEIRRSGSWMDYPVRGIIRGRWEISDYKINIGIPPSFFAGAEIVQRPLAQQQRYEWHGAILDSLPPDVRAVTDADVRRVQAEARDLVRAQALRGPRTATLSARGISDFARVNRAEGLAVGGGGTLPLPRGTYTSARGRFGFADHLLKWEFAVGRRSPSGVGIRAFARDDMGEVGDVQERSTVANSLAAQEFGSDYTDPFRMRTFGVQVGGPTIAGFRTSLTLGTELHDSVSVRAEPATGSYEPTLPVVPARADRLALAAERPTALWFFGTELSAHVSASAASYRLRAAPVVGDDGSVVLRASLGARVERPFGSQRLVSQTTASIVHGSNYAPIEELVFFGGPTSGPGYGFHELVGAAGVSQRVEWQLPVPFIPVSLGRFGRSPASATLAPYAHVVVIDALRQRGAQSATLAQGAYPSVGVALLAFFDLVRLDVAHGLRGNDARSGLVAPRWTFSVDLNHDFWGIL